MAIVKSSYFKLPESSSHVPNVHWVVLGIVEVSQVRNTS
eukprot:CAMPEP_0202430280 /NCGR_PEP_ID=MMETSP1345-20130828/3761_1 /ASSEMBLY_ACC=CAM_ASM_000843 /TAXON_ID=342563 /ORGANISM="Fabrea Fabrea salina" /LENGTH=38 /DNA_ID= /DNA_START= /DNA_END= /DNA_ORIENTATION=